MGTSLTIGLAGSTVRTVQAAECLRNQTDFKFAWVLTPPPKPIGRDQISQANPVEMWAHKHNLPVVSLPHKIDETIKTQLTTLNDSAPVDIVLVVDFGYLVPNWLLQVPKIAPINIHPSALPRWRGSSPAQYCLLFGDKASAVTIMVMDPTLDGGPIITSLPLPITATWTAENYYQAAFELVAQELPTVLRQFAALPHSTPQPAESPTPVAARLSKTDSFIEWPLVAAAAGLIPEPNDLVPSSSLLCQALAIEPNLATVLERATRAFAPWPGLWTFLPTAKGPKRLKILSTHLVQGQLVLDDVQLEGTTKSTWKQLQTAWKK